MNLKDYKMIMWLGVGILIGGLLCYMLPKYVDISFTPKTSQEQQMKQYQNISNKTTAEKAYEYIRDNVQLSINGSADVELQHVEKGLVLVITYDETAVKAIEEKGGVKEEELIADGESTIQTMVMPIKEILIQQNLDCPVGAIFQDVNGILYMITQDDEILEVYPTYVEPMKEEYVQEKK